MSNVAPAPDPGSTNAQTAQPSASSGKHTASPSKRGSRITDIAWTLLKRGVLPVLLLLFATIAAQLKLLKLLNEDWANFSWGMSQNLVASALVLLIEIPGVVKFVDSRRLVSALRQTMEDVINYDLAKIDQEAFHVTQLDKQELKKLVTRMLADSVRARSRLDSAVGRIIGAVPESNEEIDIQPRGSK